MTASRENDDNDDDDEEEDDAQYDEVPDDSDGEQTIPCPYCRRDIFDDSPRCPYCERYISEEDCRRPSYPVWVIATALLCLAAALAWIFRVF